MLMHTRHRQMLHYISTTSWIYQLATDTLPSTFARTSLKNLWTRVNDISTKRSKNEISISISISAMLLVENERGTIRDVKNTFYISGLTGTSTRSWSGPCTCALKIIYQKNISPSLKFTNRIVLLQQQSWESTYLS